MRFDQLTYCVFLILFVSSYVQGQVPASGHGFNYFDREAIFDAGDGAGFSFYAAVWPIMQPYPGPDHFQLGLPSTWLTPLETGNEPGNFYNTIEGGLGWWNDTRFATETPKFIMGGVAFDFNQWANGVGAGSTDLRPDGHRDWSEPGGKYGVAQLSPHLLWPPDGLNMEQGASGEFLGYGYHPLPITDPLEETYGADFYTGNQCWTLFLNTSNFKGPATFFLPTFWTETVLDDLTLEGLFFDSRPSDKNPAFAMEYAESPALIGVGDTGDFYARILPLAFPKTTDNRSELIRDVKVYSKEAKWNVVEQWFNGGAIPTTSFNPDATDDIFFVVDPEVDGSIGTENGTPLEARIDYAYAEKVMDDSERVAGFEWNTDVISIAGDYFVMPAYYQLNQDDLWQPLPPTEVPTATGLLSNEPAITPRPDDIPYLSPIEPDCHWQDPQSPWNNPGPTAGPFTVILGDGSQLTYYWYRFVDQPAIIHTDLPEDMRENMQERVEKIHTHWHYTDEYLPSPTGGELVGLDPGLIVAPPTGLEIGYVPIVTRQEKTTTNTSLGIADDTQFLVYPNPAQALVRVASLHLPIQAVQLFDGQGKRLKVYTGLTTNSFDLSIADLPVGMYNLKLTFSDGPTVIRRIIKIK